MSKFRQNGFTITEVITTLVILGIILAIAIPGVGKLQEKFRNDYYTQLDSTVLAAGKQYFKDNEDQRPVNLLEASFVDYNESSNELISKKYIDTVNQYNSADACTGHVVAVKLQDDYKYVNCMKCGGRTFYPESITTIQTQYDDNICHFSTTGDEIEKGYTIPSNFKIYINHYTQDDLKDKLCLSETVTRKDRAGNIL